jgi:hypothetical protein
LLGPVLAAALLAGGCTLLGAEYKSETTEIKQDSGLEQRLNNLELRLDRIERKVDRLETRR